MADGTPAIALTSFERSNVARNLLIGALNSFPEVTADDMALAVALACVVDEIESKRPGSTVRHILRACLARPNGGLPRG